MPVVLVPKLSGIPDPASPDPNFMDSRLRGNDGRGRSGLRRADYHSRFRGNDGGWRSGLRRADYHSRLRGNDGTSASEDIPAQAIHGQDTCPHCRTRYRSLVIMHHAGP